MNLSVFPVQLLEKIEELTLYAIAQQGRLDELAAQNAELKARLAELEGLVKRE